MRLTTTPSGVVTRLASHGRWSSAWVLALVLAALTLIFVLDRQSGSAPVQHLYYLPIIIAAVRFGMPGGLSAAFAAILSYHLANPPLWTLRYNQSDFVQIALFIAVGGVTAKLTHDAQRFHQLAMTDDLTGLHNLRSFEDRLVAMIRAARETHSPVALLVLDLDRLKALNDQFGHLAGAEAVRTVGHLVGSRLPPDAVACRYGGDEFVIAIPRCLPSQARDTADDLRRAVNSEPAVLAGVPFPAGTLSISVGLACHCFDRGIASGESSQRDEESGEALFRAADAALYIAKESGRNHVWMDGGNVSEEHVCRG